MVPRAILGVAGVTPIEVRVAGVTVNFAVPDFPEDGSVAVIVSGPPVVLEVANPLKPAALLMVATATLEEVQVTDAVRSFVVKSEYTPVATYCCVVPRIILETTGVTPMDDSVAAVTVAVAVPDFPVTGSVAVIVMGPPTVFEVTTPLNPAALSIVATAVFEEFQVTDDVKSFVVKSE